MDVRSVRSVHTMPLALAILLSLLAACAQNDGAADVAAEAEVLVALLGDPDYDVSSAAFDEVTRLGVGAVPALERAVDHPATRELALYALLRIGEPARPALELLLRGPTHRRWTAIAAAAGDFDPVFFASLRYEDVRADALRRARDELGFRKPDDWSRTLDAASRALDDPALAFAGALTFDPGWIDRVPHEELYLLLEHADPCVRETGLWALGFGSLGPRPEVLLESLDDPDPVLRLTAVWAIESALPQPRGSSFVTLPIDDERADSLRVWGWGGMYEEIPPPPVDPPPGEVVESWTRCVTPIVHDPEPVPAFFEAFVPALRRGLGDEHPDVAERCASALAAGREPIASTPSFVALLAGERHRSAGLRRLAAIGPAAAEDARSALLALARAESPPSDRLLFALTRCLGHEALHWLLPAKRGASLNRLSLLASLDPPPPAALEVWARIGEDPRSPLAWLAIGELARFGARGREPLQRLLAHADRERRGLAICALARLGSEAGPAVPALRELEASDDPALALAARRALAAISRVADGIHASLRRRPVSEEDDELLGADREVVVGLERDARHSYRETCERRVERDGRRLPAALRVQHAREAREEEQGRAVDAREEEPAEGARHPVPAVEGERAAKRRRGVRLRLEEQLGLRDPHVVHDPRLLRVDRDARWDVEDHGRQRARFRLGSRAKDEPRTPRRPRRRCPRSSRRGRTPRSASPGWLTGTPAWVDAGENVEFPLHPSRMPRLIGPPPPEWSTRNVPESAAPSSVTYIPKPAERFVVCPPSRLKFALTEIGSSDSDEKTKSSKCITAFAKEPPPPGPSFSPQSPAWACMLSLPGVALAQASVLYPWDEQ